MDNNPYSCEHVVPIEQEARHHLVLENEFVRAFAVEIAPHDHTLCHHHPHDYLLYVAGDADIISAARDEEPKKLSYRDGECELLTAGMVHVVENLRDSPFRNVVVELLPGAGDLKRGSEPQPKDSSEGWMDEGGKIGRIRRVFDDRGTAAVYVVNMQGGAEVEICGPAIVASLYEVMAELEKSGGSIVRLNDFKDLAWLPSLGKGLLRNRSARSARVVVFQVGCSDEQLSPARKLGQEPLKRVRIYLTNQLSDSNLGT